LNSNANLPIEEQMDKLRLKCLMDLVELAKLDKDWNPEEGLGIE
jgi:hypothetical protein